MLLPKTTLPGPDILVQEYVFPSALEDVALRVKAELEALSDPASTVRLRPWIVGAKTDLPAAPCFLQEVRAMVAMNRINSKSLIKASEEIHPSL